MNPDYLDDGWIIGGGLTWAPSANGPFAVRVDLGHSCYDATQALIDLSGGAVDEVRIDDGDGLVFRSASATECRLEQLRLP